MGRAPLESQPDLMEHVAEVLQWSHINGEKSACEQFKITLRTIQRYKQAFRTKDQVAVYVALHRKALGEQSHAKAIEAFIALSNKVIRASLQDDFSPEAMREANEGLRILGQFLTLDKAIEGRLNGLDVFGDSGTAGLPAPHHVDAAFEVVDDSDSDPAPDTE